MTGEHSNERQIVGELELQLHVMLEEKITVKSLNQTEQQLIHINF